MAAVGAVGHLADPLRASVPPSPAPRFPIVASHPKDFALGYLRELTDEERLFCETLGGTVIFWNHVESQMRGLLHYAVGAMTHRINVLIANLGNVSLAEALQAIADDHEEPLADHLRHAAKLFAALRAYRNHFVHGVVTFHTSSTASQAFAKQISAKGGALKVHQSNVSRDDLIDLHDRLGGLQAYVSVLTNCLMIQPPGAPSSSLERPPLPDKLELNRQRLIERKPQPPASRQ